VRKDGGLLWAEFHLVPIRDQDGELVATEGVMFDITERKSVESLRRESEELFHTLAAGSPVGIFRTDTHGSCTYVNDYWCALTGIGFGDALGMGWARGLHALIGNGWWRSGMVPSPSRRRSAPSTDTSAETAASSGSWGKHSPKPANRVTCADTLVR